MTNIFIPASASSPEVDFRFDERQLSLKGEAYPENAALFWGEIIAALRHFIERDTAQEPIVVNVSLAYFNSSSTKMLFSLFSVLNEKAASGTHVILNWFYDEEDDTIYEFGQELREDFTDLIFRDHAVQN